MKNFNEFFYCFIKLQIPWRFLERIMPKIIQNQEKRVVTVVVCFSTLVTTINLPRTKSTLKVNKYVQYEKIELSK